MRSRRTLRSKTTPKLRQKISWKYAAAGIAIAVFVGIGLFFYLNLGMGGKSKAAGPYNAVIHSTGTGNWSETTSWSPRLPQDGDSIVLQEGHYLSVSDMVNLKDVHISVYGTLYIENGKKINLYGDSEIVVHSPSGTIDGGNGTGAGSKITYENDPLWDSQMGPVYGYSRLDSEGFHNAETLPVELVYFKARAAQNKAIMEWATAAEINNEFFTIERSTDGKNFQTLATVEGAGNSSTQISYTYTDESAPTGTSYYRLKQTDYDGKFEYFKLIAVTIESSLHNNNLNVVSVGPNPFSQDFNLEFDLPDAGTVELRLMNMQGNVVASETIEGYSGNNRYKFSDRHGLKSGTYILSLIHNNITSKSIRMIKR